MGRAHWEGVYVGAVGVAAAVVVGLAAARAWPTLFVPAELTLAERVDAVAQHEMARAAWAMFAVTTLSAFVGALGLWAIWLNLKATQGLATDSARSAKAAEESVAAFQRASEVEQEIGRAQVRAYIAVNRAALLPEDLGFELEVEFVNSGQSPARRVSIDLAVNTRSNPADVMVDASPGKWVSLLSTSEWRPDLQAGAAAKVQYFSIAEIPEAFRTAVATGHGEIRFKGRVGYYDVFDAEHAEPFEFEVSFYGWPIENGKKLDMTRRVVAPVL